jgi:hypothetical protein
MTTRLALKDDKTTTGGSILGPSSDFYNEDGRAFALAEDLATCGNCKGSWPIGGTAHNVMDEGRSFVKDLAPVYCPCGKNRVLASAESPFFYSDDESTAPAPKPATPQKALAYDEQFTLYDGTGRVMPDTFYTVRLPTGELLHGVTDLNGRTERYTTKGAQAVSLYVGHRESL